MEIVANDKGTVGLAGNGTNSGNRCQVLSPKMRCRVGNSRVVCICGRGESDVGGSATQSDHPWGEASLRVLSMWTWAGSSEENQTLGVAFQTQEVVPATQHHL